ncbi:hypothetical protein Tco_0930883, partial [Tanacetum coccineum]
DQLLSDLAEARKKKKKRQGSPKTPPGSPLHPPPPPLPPAGPSRTSGASGTSGSSSKTAASAEYTAWTMTGTRLKPSVLPIPEELHMDDDTTADEQAYTSSGEDVGRDHVPTVNLRQSWWKPLLEDRPATPEPAWSILLSYLTVPTNNWASALKFTYTPPPENSLLAQIGDMATFMDLYCKKQGISKLTQKDLEGPAYEIVKVFHPDVVHLQFQMEECHKLLTKARSLCLPYRNDLRQDVSIPDLARAGGLPRDYPLVCVGSLRYRLHKDGDADASFQRVEYAEFKSHKSHKGNSPQQGCFRIYSVMVIFKESSRSLKSKEQSSKITT